MGSIINPLYNPINQGFQHCSGGWKMIFSFKKDVTKPRSLTASEFTPEKRCLEDKPFLLGFGNLPVVNSLLNFRVLPLYLEIKGQLGVPLTVYPWYLLCFSRDSWGL